MSRRSFQRATFPGGDAFFLACLALALLALVGGALALLLDTRSTPGRGALSPLGLLPLAVGAVLARRAKPLTKIVHDPRQIARRICELYTREDGWAVFEQVRLSSGVGLDVMRVADAIAVRTTGPRWEIVLFEVKVAGDDLARELRDRAKAEPWTMASERWIVVPAPAKDVLGARTRNASTRIVPAPWGVIEVGTGEPVPLQPAERVRAVEPEMGFLQSLLRAASDAAAEQAETGGAPLRAIARPLSRRHAALACFHVAIVPAQKIPAPVPCPSCLAGLPTEPEAIVAAIADAADEDLPAYQEAIDARMGPGIAKTAPVVAQKASAA